MTAAVEILKRAEPFLAVCGPCEYGIPATCVCPAEDYRPIMLALYLALSAELDHHQEAP